MPYIKESLINLSSCYALGAPVLYTFYTEHWKNITFAWIGLTVVTLLYPPMGWLRPHRHSERPGNRGGLRE